jgi:nucleoside diphosphate kinase
MAVEQTLSIIKPDGVQKKRSTAVSKKPDWKLSRRA